MNLVRRAVVVIDMINEFLLGQPDDHLIPANNIPGIINNVQALIVSARRANTPVVYLACAHEKTDPMFFAIPPHAMRGTWEAQIIADLTPCPDEVIIEKKTYDGFYETQLDTTLREMGISELILSGVQTDCCVHATGQGAIFRGFNVSLAMDCCDTISAERQRVGLERFRALIGPTHSLNEIIELM